LALALSIHNKLKKKKPWTKVKNSNASKVKNSNASEKVTADVLARRILDYGIVKDEKATNVVWHYFRKFCPKKLAAKRPAMDPFRLQDHALCMLCMESKDQERREHVTVKLGKCKSPTAMVDHGVEIL
jgi:hypothetical protein